MSATMHAIRQQAFGGPEVLELTEVKRPVPLPTEVLVLVRAVGVNPVEAAIRSGQFPLLGEPPPSAPSACCAPAACWSRSWAAAMPAKHPIQILIRRLWRQAWQRSRS